MSVLDSIKNTLTGGSAADDTAAHDAAAKAAAEQEAAGKATAEAAAAAAQAEREAAEKTATAAKARHEADARKKAAAEKAVPKPKAVAALAAGHAQAPIPDAIAKGLHPEPPAGVKPGREIADLAELGHAFVKPLPEAARSGHFKPQGTDPWTNRPIALADGWHHDEATKWNFKIREGRLVEARSDDDMANQPRGTHGRIHRV